jgi:hypothetical protein
MSVGSLLEEWMTRFESKPYPPGVLQPHMRQDHMLHDSVEVTVHPLNGAVYIQGGRASRLVHRRHHRLGGLHGVDGASPQAGAVDIRHRCPATAGGLELPKRLMQEQSSCF